MALQHRVTRLEARQDGTTGHRWWIRALPYNVIDNYGTTFAPGVFGDVLEDPPPLLYGHDYTGLHAVLGRVVDARDSDEALDLLVELDDFDAVPAARQVSAQLASGTLRRFSVGFEPEAQEPTDLTPPPGAPFRRVMRITRARLVEVSIVIGPAVPGTKVLAAARSRASLAARSTDGGDGLVPLELLREIARYVDRGLITVDQGREYLVSGVVPAPVDFPDQGDPSLPVAVEPATSDNDSDSPAGDSDGDGDGDRDGDGGSVGAAQPPTTMDGGPVDTPPASLTVDDSGDDSGPGLANPTATGEPPAATPAGTSPPPTTSSSSDPSPSLPEDLASDPVIAEALAILDRATP